MTETPPVEESLRGIYERNPVLRFLNHRHPALFRIVWEAYLALRSRRIRLSPASAPLSPTTPLLQARGWPRPVPDAAHKSGPRILFFSFTGWSTMMIWDGMLGRALALRGAEVSYMICGGVLPLCYIQTAASDVPPMPCGRCRAYADSAIRAFGFTPDHMRHLVPSEEWQRIEREVTDIADDELVAYTYDGMPLGYFATVSTRWFLLDTEIQLTPEVAQRLRQYILLGRLVHAAVQKLLVRDQPERIVMFNGLHIGEQVVRALAERRSIPYTCIERGYVANTVIAAHKKAVAGFPFEPIWERYRDRPLTTDEEDRLIYFINQRRYGAGQMDSLWEGIEESAEAMRRELDLQPGRPLVAAFTNVAGDTALLDRDIAYRDIREWIDHLIALFAERPDVDLVFRIHPAESRKARYRPRTSFGDYIRAEHLDLPPNVKVIPSESTLSSYTLLDMSDLVAVYTSSMGLEAAASGKPTITAAQVHYRGKGFTIDAAAPGELATLLQEWDGTPGSLPPRDLDLAQRYAYMFYFRAMIPLDEVMEEREFGRMRLRLDGWDALRPGATAAIDLLCDDILNETPFTNPFEA